MDRIKIDTLLCDVRKAHRLLYEYQRRMLDLVFFIARKYKFPESNVSGKRRFCQTIKTTRGEDSEYANLNIRRNMWAWDFLYSKEFEYYFKFITKNNQRVYFSLIQVSDTGNFNLKTATNGSCKPSNYSDVDDSQSYLLFVLENANRNMSVKHFYTKELNDGINNIIKGDEHALIYETGENTAFVMMKFNLNTLFNEESVMTAIVAFNDIVKSKTNINLL